MQANLYRKGYPDMTNFSKYVMLMMLLFVVGCGTSAQRLNQVSVGMTKQDVVRVLGNPESVSAANGQEVLVYTLSNSWNSQFWNSRYQVVIQNGRVVAYG
jgi:outer membrane protein assembly factor BamE (lipoprotein component of BamABCDE complex)